MPQPILDKAKAVDPEAVAAAVISRWRGGAPADAAAVLSQCGELAGDLSLVVDLAYEEFCQRVARGESIDRSSFAARFPQCRSSLARRLEVHDYLAAHRSALADAEPATWPDPEAGLPGFRLCGELGRGALARVYLARETALGERVVALKLSLAGADEAQLHGKLDHPYIVPLYSARERVYGRLTAICMPYLGRTTLEDVIRAAHVKGNPPPDLRSALGQLLAEARRLDAMAGLGPGQPAPLRGSFTDWAIELCARLAEGLAHAHAKGIVHRDLKPTNVLLATDGAPRLLDFNLAEDAGADLRRVGGTLAYMSPEQIRQTCLPVEDRTETVDRRSDLYSLGIVAYQLLSGQLPFGPLAAEPSLAEARRLLAAQRAGPRPLREAYPPVPRRLAELVERMLSFAPSARPVSAAAVAAELRAIAERAESIRSARQKLLAVAAIVLIAGVGLWQWSGPPRAQRWLDAGQRYYAAGQYDDALDAFQRALDARFDLTAALLGRARSRLARGDRDAAISDFIAVYQRVRDPRLAAMLGYCYCRKKLNAIAESWYRRAIDEGYDSPPLRYGFAIALSQAGKLPEALAQLDEALRQNPRLQAASLQRAQLQRRIAQSTPAPLGERAKRDIERVLELGPVGAYSHYLAASIYRETLADVPNRRALVLTHLKTALRQGVSRQLIRDAPLWRAYCDDPEVQALLAAPAVAEVKDPAFNYDPLADLPIEWQPVR